MDLLSLGTRVTHRGHGAGTIVSYNGVEPNSYILSRRGLQALQGISSHPVLAAGVMAGVYNGERYPYVVQFDAGYQDVYNSREFRVVT